MLKKFACGWSFVLLNSEAFLDKIFALNRNFTPEWTLHTVISRYNVFEELVFALASEWVCSADYLISQHSQTPDVALTPVMLGLHNLRSYVIGSSDEIL